MPNCKRPRFEYRNSFKTLLEREQEANSICLSAFQVTIKFFQLAISLKFSLQNVRTWGDVTPETEIDLFGSHKLRKDLTASLGYSQMFADSSMEILKGDESGRNQNWAWVMISFHPQLFSINKSPTSSL